jgi:hypothetical protein
VSDLVPQLRRFSSDDADRFQTSFIINAHIELSISIAQVLVSYECSNDKERAQLDQTKESFWNINGTSDYPIMSEILQWFYPNYQGIHRVYIQCFPAMARLAVYKTALRQNEKALCGFVRHISKNYDSDVQLAATECILEAWKGAGTFSGLCDAYSPLIHSEVSMARTIAYNNLSSYLDKYFYDAGHLHNQKTFWTLLNLLQHYSPASFLEQPAPKEGELAARIKFGAWLSVAAFHSSKQINWDAFEKGVFRLWSHRLTWGGEASNVSFPISHVFFNTSKHS